MIRAFVALPLPDRHRRELGRYLARCSTAAPAFRWVPGESLHLTLRFAGNLDEAVAGRLRAALGGVRHDAFELRLANVGTFGSRRAATVVWLGLAAGAEPAAELARLCEEACQEAGLEPEARAFRPHVTLARARERRAAQLPELPPPPELPAWRAEELVLFRSELRGGRPPVYAPIETYPLMG